MKHSDNHETTVKHKFQRMRNTVTTTQEAQ
jgi:hypothetical protein